MSTSLERTSSPWAESRPAVLGDSRHPLSATFFESATAQPRAVIVAIHGAGMRAGYFDARTDPALSLCSVATRLGYSVLAVDRPGYGESAAWYPCGLPLDEQADVLCEALTEIDCPAFLLAHSYGGALALTAAARAPELDLIGIDVSGIGHRRAHTMVPLGDFSHRRAWPMHWGKLGLYPPRTFELAAPLAVEVPFDERADILRWPDRMPAIAGAVQSPVRFTFAEYERWWAHDDDAVAELESLFAPGGAVIDRLPGAGHNISLSWAAASYHLAALAFLEQSLARCFADGKSMPRSWQPDISLKEVDTA